MPDQTEHRETWLVAVWPGMGNIAVGAGAYLVAKLGARLIHELPGRDVFDLQHIDVKNGLAMPGRLPRSLFFEWRNPRTDVPNARDLLIFIGEAQPTQRGYAFCQRMLEYAAARGITRVFSFAAMATQLHPADAPRVFGAGTEQRLLDELRALEVLLLQEGQISGLNGVLLSAAAERGLPAVCLLGELPYFAAAVPNPRASQAVLQTFSSMAGIEVDFADLKQQAETVERALLELLEKMKEAAQQQQEEGGEGFALPEPAIAQEEEPAAPPKPREPTLPPSARKRIETLFEAAGKDRTKAVHLKEHLDKLGVFKQYEDRFLDLFKRAD